jgi:cystathionine beta-lyase
MQYNFDKIIERRGTDSVKYDILKPLYGREDVIPMWVADMDFEVPDFIREAVIRRAEHEVYGYTIRPKRFYETIAGWLSSRHGWVVDPGHIDFSPGVVPALVLAVLGFTSPGDKILVQSPVYFPFFSSIENHNRVMVNNQLKDEQGRYTIDFDHLEERFREGVKMMLFCHPHNPVGRAWTREELIRLAALAVQYDVLILSDEIHSDLLLFGHRHIPLASLGEEIASRTITCIAPSKTFNLAGLHTSAVVIGNQVLKKQYEKILEDIHIGGGNLFGFVALEAAYSHGAEWLGQLNSYLEQNFEFLKGYLQKELPFVRVSPLEATYLSWLNFGALEMDDKELMKFMIDKAKIGFVDGPRFGAGGEHYLRMNIATPRSVLKRALDQMTAALKEHVPKMFYIKGLVFMRKRRQSILMPVVIYAAVLLLLLVLIALSRDADGPLTLLLLSVAVVYLLLGIILFLYHIYFPLIHVSQQLKSISRAEPVYRKGRRGAGEFREIDGALQQHLQRLKEIAMIARELSEGDIAETFRAMGEQDEIGHAILKLKEGIVRSNKEALARRKLDEQQNWASYGLARFGEMIRDFEHDTGDSSNAFIRELVKYIDVEVGGLFLMRRTGEGEPVLEMTGAYAFDREKSVKRSFLPGEGLVGRCALEKQSILISDVPADYIRIRSGMGEDLPSMMLLVPIMFDEEVLGVIELASFAEIEPYKISFLESLSRSAAPVLSRLGAAGR